MDEQKIQSIKFATDELQKARLIEKAIKEDISVTQIASKLGVSSAYVYRYRRFARLPDIVTDGYLSGLISTSHLMVISRLKNTDDMTQVYEMILTQNLAVHQIENIVREKIFNITPGGERVSKKVIASLEDVALWLDRSCKMKVIQSRRGVKISFEAEGNLAKTTKIIERLAERLEL